MRALVCVASKYGATREIADAIGRTLSESGADVTVLDAGDVDGIDGYDTIVIGSAVYAGHWLAPARELIERHPAAFADKRVWLFSSGPIGEPPVPKEHAVDVEDLVAATGAIEHRLFAGKLDKHRLSFAERAIVFALRVAEGDFRDWGEIGAWAEGIARA